MGRKTLMRAVLVAAATFGSVVATGTTPVLAEPAVAVSSGVDMATVLRDRVRKMALTDPLAEVRSEAWNAVLSNRGDEAIREFVSSGYARAKARAQQRIDSNVWYIRDINRFAIPGSAVQVTSGRALVSSWVAQEDYVHSGYDRAQQLDRENDNKYQERLARLAREDREYVAFLAANDPGVQVKAAAQRAVAGDDTSIGLFFKYYWKIGADQDSETFRRTTIEQNEVWHAKIRRLTEAALAAEKAERESSGELARKARQDAIAHWQEAEREADRSSVDWNGEKAKADAQAAAWARIAQHARSAQTEQDWAAILAQANQSNTSWQDEAEWAKNQAATWQALADEARKAAEAAKNRDQGER